MVVDELGEVGAIHHVGLHAVIALEELHLALVHVGLEHLGDVVEIARGPVDDVLHVALFDLVLQHELGVEHGHLLRTGQVAGDDGDIVELLDAGLLGLVVEVQIALVVDVVGREPGGCGGEAHGGDDHIRPVAEALQGLRVGGVDGPEGVLALQTVLGALLQIGGDHLAALVGQYFQNFEAQVAEGSRQYDLHTLSSLFILNVFIRTGLL